MRSRICLRQFKAERPRDDFFFEGTPDTFSSSVRWPKLQVVMISDYSLLKSVLHLCTLEQMRIFL